MASYYSQLSDDHHSYAYIINRHYIKIGLLKSICSLLRNERWWRLQLPGGAPREYGGELIFVWVMCDGGTKRWYHALQNRIFLPPILHRSRQIVEAGGAVNSVPAFSAVLRVF